MMSWLHEREQVAVEFWSGSGPPGKCLQTLSLQFSKSVDGFKLILSARRPEASSARSQGKPKMAVRIAGGRTIHYFYYYSTLFSGAHLSILRNVDSLCL